jgi:hypothetical protein
MISAATLLNTGYRPMPTTVIEAAAALAAGRTSATALVEAALARIADPAGEGARAFMVVHAETARATANAMDALRKAGRAPSPYAGIPISVKDLYGEAGITSRSGSVVLKGSAPAAVDAPTVQRLRRAGFVVLGRTNMVEFAFSGLGVNPHYGTPKSPWDRATGRGVLPPALVWRWRMAWALSGLARIRAVPAASLRRFAVLSAGSPRQSGCRLRAFCLCRLLLIPPGPWRAALPIAR